MRTALFFDGKNFYSAWRDQTNRQPLDFVKLSHWLVAEAGGSRLWAAHYYTGIESGAEADSPGQQSLSRFLDWLDEEPGYFVQRLPRRVRSLTCDHCNEAVRYTEEKEVDTTLVADLVRLAAINAYDIAVLISGDGDFASALEATRALGKQTYIATWGKAGLSSRLRRAAYHHLDLLDGLPIFGKDFAPPRPAPRPDPTPPVAAALSLPTLASAAAAVGAQELDAELPEHLAHFLDELRRAEGHFRDRGGYLGANYFVTRWVSDYLPPSLDTRREYLTTLESLGRLEVYETESGDRAIRMR